MAGIKMSDANSDPDVALSCPICMERYSDTRYPVAAYCGHSICKECGIKRKSHQCVSCLAFCFYDVTNKTSPWPSDKWTKNFALLDIVNLYTTQMKSVEEEKNALKTKCENAIIPNDIDYKKCSRCESMEKKERLKICDSCAKKRNVEWKGMDEKEIGHFILCAHCCLKEHSGHKLIDYLPWKIKELVSSTVTSGRSDVFSMDDICAYEGDKGKEELRKWNEEMNSFTSLQLYSHRDGTSIANSLKLESDLLTRFSEDCIPPLRKFRKVVTDSTFRLHHLRKEVNDGEFDIETSDSWHEEITGMIEGSTSSRINIQKKHYKKKIRKLKHKLDHQKVDLEVHDLIFDIISRMIQCNRFPFENKENVRFVEPEDVNRLHFTVSHPMTLVAVDMHQAVTKTTAVGHFKICTSVSGSLLFEQDYPLWEGRALFSDKVIMTKPKVETRELVHPQLTPGVEYVIEMTVKQSTKLYHGSGGKKTVEIVPGKTITFSSYGGDEKNMSSESIGEFPGFYFLI